MWGATKKKSRCIRALAFLRSVRLVNTHIEPLSVGKKYFLPMAAIRQAKWNDDGLRVPITEVQQQVLIGPVRARIRVLELKC